MTYGATREAVPDPGEALTQLEELMCVVANGALPGRGDATAYSQARADVLAAPDGPPLPGFVHQCLTVFKFRDFITLYDPDAGVRESFVRRAFARSREAIGGAAQALPASAQGSRRWRF